MKALQTKHILLLFFLSFSIPALLLLFLLIFYTVSQQITAETLNYQNHLKHMGSNMEQVLERSEKQLNNITAIGTPFQMFHHSDTQLKKHQNAYDILPSLKASLTQESCIGGYFLYSTDYSYYCPAYQCNYAYSDQKIIKDYLTQSLHPAAERNQWIPFPLSDRIVLFRLSGFDSTICAVMIDPALDASAESDSGQQEEPLFFYASKEGTPYTAINKMENYPIHWSSAPTQTVTIGHDSYRLIKYPLNGYDLQLCCLVPHESVWTTMNLFQKLLLLGIILLIFYDALILVFLYRRIIHPIRDLSNTMLEISAGNLDLRIPEKQPTLELLHFSQVFNRMLYNIQQLKVETYTKQLNLQQARLQYLQLQIRPHFYLNCLKSLFSMAERKQYKEIQESILSLSDYFRYIFRNNQEFVSFSQEIHSVTCYQQLQKLNFSCIPRLTMDIAADVVDVPLLPLSILTFVENSIKYATDRNHVHIHIRAAILPAEEQPFLNISISDNGGGFSPESLETLNHLDTKDFLYQDYHVGIYNVYYRMKLAYKEQASLAFYNNENGGTVELFIPVKTEGSLESI